MKKAQSSADISIEQFFFPSTESATSIHAVIWNSTSSDFHPKGIVQLLHGMSEYIERYHDFACFLVKEGYLVAGHDHLAHGESINTKDDWGNLPAKTGKDILIEDAHYLRHYLQNRFGEDLPYYIFGHSMGSFVVRNYIARYGSDLNGAIICGTGHQPESKAGNLLAQIMASIKGNAHHSDFFHHMVNSGFANAIPQAQTAYDWLNTSPQCVQEYLEDDACGFIFSIGGYAVVTDLSGESASKKTIAHTPDTLPLLFISGTDDPVGGMSKGVKRAVSLFEKAGKNVSLILYEGMRHEILNEPEHMRVYRDVLAWIHDLGKSRE